jgi:hypothetical protein
MTTERRHQSEFKTTEKDSECCYGLVRLTEKTDTIEKVVEKEEGERKAADIAIWKGIDLMRNMVIAGMGSVVLAMAVFIGSIFMHVTKVGP